MVANLFWCLKAEIQQVEIQAANFSQNPSKTKYELGSIYIQVQDTGTPWAPFGDGWSHLTFTNTALGYSYLSGKALADGGPIDPSPKGETSLNLATQMQINSLQLNVQFNYSSSATTRQFMFVITDIGTQELDLIDLISNLLNDVHGGGISTISFPEDAKNLFDINI